MHAAVLGVTETSPTHKHAHIIYACIHTHTHTCTHHKWTLNCDIMKDLQDLVVIQHRNSTYIWPTHSNLEVGGELASFPGHLGLNSEGAN